MRDVMRDYCPYKDMPETILHSIAVDKATWNLISRTALETLNQQKGGSDLDIKIKLKMRHLDKAFNQFNKLTLIKAN